MVVIFSLVWCLCFFIDWIW